MSGTDDKLKEQILNNTAPLSKLPAYLNRCPSIRGQQAEKKFAKKNPGLKQHARSGAGVFLKDDFSVSGTGGCRIEMKLICRGTVRHTLNVPKLMALIKRAEGQGQVPVYLMKFETGEELVLMPKRYLKGVTNGS